MPDASWFYSSLSQVTAAIVGFVGGFLVLRLLDFIRDWGSLLARLESSQSEWSNASAYADHEKGDSTAARQRESLLWTVLYRTIQERHEAKMPSEILVGGALLLLLMGVGVVWPLASLRAPSNGTQSMFLVPFNGLVLAFAVLMYVRGRAALKKLKDFKLWDRTEGDVVNYEMQIEAWQAEDEWRKQHATKQREETSKAPEPEDS
jgi:hypothetical protein